MIAITGLGAVSALGDNCAELWRGIAAGRDGIDDIARFDTSGFRVSVGAVVPAYRDAEIADLSVGFRLCTEIAVTAAREAWQDARVAEAPIDPSRIGLCIGTLFVDATRGRRPTSAHQLCEAIAAALGIHGPCLSVATACASSTNAVGLGSDLLRMGSADLVLAGGVDVLNSLVFAGFHSLAVLSATTCAPFSQPTGTVLGEGAGFVVLERERTATSRKIPVKAWYCGYGLSSDAYHETSPDPSGRGVERALGNALGDAALTSEQIDYVNAHGTGTVHNDLSEWQGLKRVFGERAETQLLLSSSKSFLGHAQGAAGILELIATILGMQRDVVPPTLHFVGPRPRGPGDPVAQATPRPARVRYAASLNAGFGGSNAAVIVAGRDVPPAPAPLASDRRPRIRVIGLGAVGTFGTDVAALLAQIDAQRSVFGPMPAFRLGDLGLVASPKRSDPLSRYLSAAASLALRDAGVRISKHNRGRTGLIAGITRLSPYSVEVLNRSIDSRGLARLSATAFPRMLLSAPAGTCTRLLEIQGPTSTVSIGPGSGLAAVIYAAELLARRADADCLLAGGADELDRRSASASADLESEPTGEGAACVLLSSLAAEHAPASAPDLLLAGWAVAGPGRVETAVDRALTAAGLTRADVQLVFATGPGSSWPTETSTWIEMTRLLGRAECMPSAAAVVAAAATIRRGDADTVAVLDTLSQSASCALVLTTRELS